MMIQKAVSRLVVYPSFDSPINRKEYLKSKYLRLVFCKYCIMNLDSNEFGIGLNIRKYVCTQYITDKNGKKRKEKMWQEFAIPVGQTIFDIQMMQWSIYNWALFVMFICKTLKLPNIKQIQMSYKFIRNPSENSVNLFNAALENEFNKLKKKKDFKNIFKHKIIKFELDVDVIKDIVLHFDTDPFNIFYPMCQNFGFSNIDTTQKIKPAVTFCIERNYNPLMIFSALYLPIKQAKPTKC